MVMPTSPLVLLSLLATTSTVAGDEILKTIAAVINHCDYPIFLWSVSSTLSPRYRIAPGHGSYCERIHHNDQSGGIALKITRNESALFDEGNQMVFGYNLDHEDNTPKLFFSLVDIFGTPFENTHIRLESDHEECDPIQWPDGTNPGHGNFLRVCSPDYNVIMTVCVDEAGDGTPLFENVMDDNSKSQDTKSG